ncbi:nuclear transport factor 2 family protein [Flavobacteriaceae bacterium S356]|uniref:Nuclear transport factor 2 family protein n=1 Tax=Asprobacillus argus TaxID=3076534 RepID=A0ABU3LGN1_9FLAO|nr:nuclear transport factor 2 family protein [Flavobacteriaceae bacterium S356]
MKYLKLLLPTLLLAFTSCSISNATSESPTKESLLEAVNKFNRAFSEGDVATLVTMITDDYKHTNGSSKAISAQSWLSYLNKRNNDLASKDLIVHSYDMDQIEIVLDNTWAIVTGRVKTVSTFKGIRKESEFRITHLWTYENERWKRAGFHDGKIK